MNWLWYEIGARLHERALPRRLRCLRPLWWWVLVRVPCNRRPLARRRVRG